MSERRPRASEGHFIHALGLMDATAIVAGAMIGSGIFIVSQDIAASVGAPGWLLVVWALTGVMTVVGALNYAELAAMYPAAGGQYVFLREAYSPLFGFLYGWTLFLVIQCGTLAAVAVAFAKYLGVLMPGVSSTRRLWEMHVHAGGRPFTFGISSAQLVGMAMIALLTAVNCVGVRAAKRVQNIFTAAKALALASIIGVGLLWARHDAALFAPGFFTARGADGHLLGATALFVGIWTSMVGSMFSADAWNNVTFIAAEVRSPERNIARALVLGTGLVIALYFLVNVAYLALLPMSGIAGAPESRVAAAAVGRVFPWGAVAMAVVVMVSTFGCLNGMILAGPRLYYAMARDGLFFAGAGRLGRRSGVPVRGLLIQGLWASALTLSGTYSQLLDYVIFAALLFYVLTVIGLFILRRRAPEMPRPYRVVGYPVVPAIYILAACVMMGVLLVEKPLYTWPGLGIVALGVPVYGLWRRFARAAGRSDEAADSAD